MEAPCVRVARENGERTRQALDEAGLLDHDLEIDVADGRIYLPVTDERVAGAVPEDVAYEVVAHPTERREGQTMPADELSFEPSYERLGDIAIVDEDDPGRAREIARAIVDSDLPVETVVNRASPVEGTERVREWEVLEGEDTETVHREYGCEYLVDIAEVYFSPRLATERHRVTEQVGPGDHAFDMFAGVGPFVVPFAKRGATCVGVDVNERAIEYLRENARRNGVEDRITAVCGDVREVAADWEGWADRIVMNLPHSADDFLDTAVSLSGDEAVIHYYDIQHESDPYGPGEAAIREAAHPEYDLEVLARRTVRSYAPHELNVVIDVRITR